ncbi:MAG TPA: hypothetical protein VFZ26_10215 [Gemmatimonadales bacterium]
MTGTRTGARARWGAIQGKGLEAGTQALLVLLLPRILGPADFGRLAVSLAVVALGTAALSLGAPSAFSRFVPAESPRRRAGLARAMTVRLIPVRAVQVAAAAAVAIVLMLAAPRRFPAPDALLVVLALALELAAILGVQAALGLGRTRLWSFRLAVRNATLLVAVPLLFHLAGPPGVLHGLVLASLAAFAAAGWPGLRLMRGADLDVPIPDGAFRYGVVAGTAGLLLQLTYRAPVIATTLLTGSAIETGHAALAGGIALAILLAVRELFAVSLPELVETWGRDREQAEGQLRAAGWRLAPPFVLAALGGMLVLERGLVLIAGPAFAPAVDALVPILVLLPLLPLPAIGWQGAALRLRPGLGLRISAVGAIVCLAAAALLVPRWGAPGASTALALAVTVTAAHTAWELPGSVPPRLLLVSALGALGALALAWWLGLVP